MRGVLEHWKRRGRRVGGGEFEGAARAVCNGGEWGGERERESRERAGWLIAGG